jgi:uncharacterized iron-regulated protein
MSGLTRRRILAAMAGAAATGWLAGCSVPRDAAGEPIVLTWQSPHFRDHPLVGRLYAPADDRFLSEADALGRLAEARYVLLGESHENPDHHRLQVRFIEGLIERGRRPAVAFEMISSSQRRALERHLARNPRDAAGLGPAIGWEQSGWPPWRLYQPIVAAALAGGLPIVPASLAPHTVRSLGRDDPASRDLAVRLGLTETWPEALQESLEREIVDAHCGQVEGGAVGAMVRVQRVRDAGMARTLIDASRASGVVLIAGVGHCRNDRGVPYHLRHLDDGAISASLAFIEVSRDGRSPSDYANAFDRPSLPFDLVCFTPRVDIRNACERFRDQLEGLKKQESG